MVSLREDGTPTAGIYSDVHPAGAGGRLALPR